MKQIEIPTNMIIEKLINEIALYVKENAILKSQVDLLNEELEALTTNISNGGNK